MGPMSQSGTLVICGDATHRGLVALAEKWLWKRCGVVFQERFRAVTPSGEQPDASGFRQGVSILIECKVSRNDFASDLRKPFRVKPETGLGDWRFYLCPTMLIAPEELPRGWGLLYANGNRVKAVCGIPGNTGWGVDRPFSGTKVEESYLLYSALRRMVIRGHFNSIYEPLYGCPAPGRISGGDSNERKR